MRIAKVMGTLTLNQRDEQLPDGKLLICEVLDTQALAGFKKNLPRKNPMPESLIAFDDQGAGVGCLIALAESGEAAAPFWPKKVPLDAYCAAILDDVMFES